MKFAACVSDWNHFMVADGRGINTWQKILPAFHRWQAQGLQAWEDLTAICQLGMMSQTSFTKQSAYVSSVLYIKACYVMQFRLHVATGYVEGELLRVDQKVDNYAWLFLCE